MNKYEDDSSEMEDFTPINLIQVQQQILKKILCFGLSEDDDDTDIQVGENQVVPRSLFTFKALIYDTPSQNMIAPVMKIGNLRDCNIVFHANINQKREQIPDLPALYLVEPTNQNYKMIAQDARDKLYDLVIVNFTQPVPNLQEFAKEMQNSRQSHRVISVISDCLGAFQVIGPDFFVFQNGGFSKVYSESQIASQVYVDSIANSIINLYRCLNLGSPSVKVTDDLSKKISAKLHLLSKQSPCSGKQSLLLLWPRTTDCYTPVYHSWTYLSQIHDIFNIKNNTFQFKEDPNGPSKTFEICLETDSILKDYGLKGFHEVSENVGNASVQWIKDYEQIQKNSQTSNISNMSGVLTSAMDAIPAMTEAKRKIDMHVNIATKLNQEIRRRELDKLQDVEDEIMKCAGLSNATKQLIDQYCAKQDVEKSDLIRLLVILCLSNVDRRYTENLLEQLKCVDQNELKMCQKLFEISKPATNQNQEQQSGIFGLAVSVAQGSRTIIERVLGKDKKMALVNYVKSAVQNVQNKVPLPQGQYYMNTFSGAQTQTLLYMPQQVVVIACGGGSFVDYELLKGLQLKNVQVVYGCDTVYNPNEFINQLKLKYS